MAPLLCSAWTDCGNVVHEPSRNKESLSLLRIESLPISAFIRSRFGLKGPVKFTEQGVPWLLAASRFLPGKNAGCLAVGSPLGMRTPGGSTCGGRQSRSSSGGVLWQICSAIWRILPASCFRPYTHPSRGCHPSAPLGPSCKAKCRLGEDPAADGLGLVSDKGLATPRPN